MMIGSSVSNAKGENGTKPIINIAVISISLGLAVMLIALAIVTGFQNEIRSKVIGFGSHIQITHFNFNNSVEAKPISKNQPFYPSLDTVDGIRHIQVYATKAGIIKTNTEVHGIVLKGISSDFDWSFFSKNLTKGSIINFNDSLKSDEVIISNLISEKLNLKLGDKFRVYFIQEPIRQRSFTVKGIYESGMAQLDQAFILGDIRHIQKLNNWEEDQISGFDITIENYSNLENLDDFIYNYIGYELNASKITDRHQEIFGWLDLLDINVVVILLFATLVAAINMISALLILILEKTTTIGLLKALGAYNWQIRKIFLYKAAFLIGKGLLIGNLTGIGLCVFQYYSHFFTLPQESYYLSFIPININIMHILFINIITFTVCLSMLLLPSYVITKITPVKAIRFN